MSALCKTPRDTLSQLDSPRPEGVANDHRLALIADGERPRVNQQVFQRDLGFFGGSVLGEMRCQLPDDKFLKDIRGGGCTNTDSRVFKR